jgi:glycosyltransferase involved in cell wall biosynthesis
MQHLSIYAPASGLTLPAQAFGKDVANLGLFRALAEHGNFQSLNFLTAESLTIDQLKNSLLPNGGNTTLQLTDLLDFYSPSASGVLFRGQPYIAELAWLRSAFRKSNAYSLIGLIHTLAPPYVREQIGAVTIAPIQAWDALICTSPSVVNAIEKMFDGWEMYIRQRLCAQKIIRPQFPMIPLGVDLGRQKSSRTDRMAKLSLTKTLGISSSDIFVLWVGRLSYYEKAFPQPMFLALQKAYELTGFSLHFVMAGWFPGGEEDHILYRESARICCPDVNVHFIDGMNSILLSNCWSSADIFLSLVDNIQETFGLSPIEAMAAGIPVVVSDWDGYRYTVRNGVDGFLIPTIAGMGGGIGDELAARHSVGLMSYQTYVGAVAQHTVVDIDAAAAALSKLLINPNLRNLMGKAGQENVAQRFDWPVIIKQYHSLFIELAEVRKKNLDITHPPMHPLRGNPFNDFSGFATCQLTSNSIIALAMNGAQCINFLDGLSRLDFCYSECHLDLLELKAIVLKLHDYGPITLESLLAKYPIDIHQSVAMGVSWLAKLGRVRLINL